MNETFMVHAHWNGNKWCARSEERFDVLTEADNFPELLGRLEQELPRILEGSGLWPAGSDELQFVVNGALRGKGWARRAPV